MIIVDDDFQNPISDTVKSVPHQQKMTLTLPIPITRERRIHSLETWEVVLMIK